MKKVLIICGEKSGDIQGSHLVKAIKKLNNDIDFYAIGGIALKNEGVKILIDSTNWGCIGIIEGIKKFPTIYPALRRMKKLLEEIFPDLIILIDFRFFNMKVAKIAKELKIPIVYYFSPVSWGGKGKARFKLLAKYIDLALLTFPFAIDDYKKAGVNYFYIGHPTVEIMRTNIDFNKKFLLNDKKKKNICLLPGSRIKEIKLILPIFLKSAELIYQDFNDVQFILLLADKALWKYVSSFLRNIKIPIIIYDKYHYEVMNSSDLLIITSGTATVEATCLLKPMVVGYRVSFLSEILIRLLVKIKYVSIPNIIADKMLVSEFIQEKLTPQNITNEVLKLITSEEKVDEMRKNLLEVRNKLHGENALTQASEIVNNFLSPNPLHSPSTKGG